MRSHPRRTTAALSACLLMVLTVLAWPSSPATGADPRTAESTGSGQIAGRVLSAKGLPVQSPTIDVYTLQSGQWVRTDLDDPTTYASGGLFTTPALPAGTYRLRAFDYMTEDEVFFNGVGGAADATDIAVLAGQTTELGDLRLQAAASISGRVLSASGVAKGEVAVSPFRLEGGSWVGTSPCSSAYGEDTVRTNENGQYKLTGLRPGTYRIEFCAGDAAFEYWNNAANLGTATSVALNPGQAVTGVDARLEAAGTITGRVFGAGGAVAPCTEVRAYHQVSGAWKPAPSFAGVENDGSFRLEGLRAGTYRVGAVDDGGCSETGSVDSIPVFSGNVEDVVSAANIAVTAGGNASAGDLSMAQGGAGLEGRVTGRDGNAAVGLVPTLYRVVNGAWTVYRSYAPTDANGYSIPDARVGTYRVGFVDPNGGAPTQFWGGETVEDARSFTVTAGQTPQRLDITLGELFIATEAAPAVVGTAIVGRTLSATPGSYAPGDVEIDYRWLANGKAISGATSPTFVPGAAEVGAKVSVQVTATAAGHAPAQAVSPATPAVRRTTVVARVTAGNTRAGSDVLAVRTSQPLAATSYVTFYRKSGKRWVRVKTGRLNAAGELKVTVKDHRKRKRAAYHAKVSTGPATSADTSNSIWVR